MAELFSPITRKGLVVSQGALAPVSCGFFPGQFVHRLVAPTTCSLLLVL